jgi:diguanylate cyclase (GGDEF)-like protein
MIEMAKPPRPTHIEGEASRETEQIAAAGRGPVLPSSDALRVYASTLRAVFDDVPIAIAVIEPDGRLALWNRELDELVPEAASGGPSRDLGGLLRALRRAAVEPAELDRLDVALAERDLEDSFELALADGGALALSVAPLHQGDGAHLLCLRDASGELHARRELEHRALHDALTNLPNRELLLDRLSVALARRVRAGTSVGVIFIDLDRFKAINDEHGHSVGDELLVSVAHRLQREVRDGDTVARYGGDEFVVLCEDLTSAATAAPLARRLEAAIAQPVTAGGRLLGVTASVGVVVESDPAADPEAVLAHADAEMYRHKRRLGQPRLVERDHLFGERAHSGAHDLEIALDLTSLRDDRREPRSVARNVSLWLRAVISGSTLAASPNSLCLLLRTGADLRPHGLGGREHAVGQ